MSPATLVEHGFALLDMENPVEALASLRLARAIDADDPAILVGLGRAHLLLGESRIAEDYADAALRLAPDDDGAHGLRIRAMLTRRRFAEAVEAAERAFEAGRDGVQTMAAYASALFRVQRNGEAAAVYRRVLRLDPNHPEAHLRLGSGLSSPREAPSSDELREAIDALARGQLIEAVSALRGVLSVHPGHPVAHRLMGETLFALRSARSMASTSPEFLRLNHALPWPAVDFDLAREFVPEYPALERDRRRVAARGLAMFRTRLPELLRKNGRHDLMREAERTTDHESRAPLRGKRTFDGRVWDDVRGIGGLRAATGIEALDEAARLGFDTFVHEMAHQVHLYALGKRSLEVRIRELYRRAIEHGRCLDYYAASNYAEYFGQGVEAFSSLGKRPTSEATHGHTRFELMRVDPELHDLIRELVDFDPLGAGVSPALRTELLDAAIDVALRCGRAADALTAAELLGPGEARDRRMAQARRAVLLSRSL